MSMSDGDQLTYNSIMDDAARLDEQYPFEGMTYTLIDYNEFDNSQQDGCVTSYLGMEGSCIELPLIMSSVDAVVAIDAIQTRLVEMEEYGVPWKDVSQDERDRLKFINAVISYLLDELVE
jgi:hypothetical protein